MSYVNETPPPTFHEPPPRQVSVKLPSVNPSVTYTLIGLTVLSYFLQQISPGYENALIKNNADILAGQIWRLLTPVLLHGPLMHIGFNMYALFAIGAGMESRMGHARFLLLYLASGFAGNVFSFFFTNANSLGASTAIFGLLAAEGVFLYQNKGLFGKRAQRALGNIIMVAAFNLFIGISPVIDNWGHIGGLLGGLIFASLGGPRWELEGVYPLMHLVDRRDFRNALVGAAVVWGIFSAVAMVKFFF